MAEQVSPNESLETHPILGAIAEREPVRAVAKVRDAHVVVTDRRLAVASDARLMLDVAIDNVRRIQFDIERLRPATLVVVPENPIDERRCWPSDPRSTGASRRCWSCSASSSRLAGQLPT